MRRAERLTRRLACSSDVGAKLFVRSTSRSAAAE
jgi:hypothetical protein